MNRALVDRSTRAKSSVRKEGAIPSRELPHRNLNRDVGEVSGGNYADPVRQTTSENAEQRQLSGRIGPVLDLLEKARKRWATWEARLNCVDNFSRSSTALRATTKLEPGASFSRRCATLFGSRPPMVLRTRQADRVRQ